MKELLKTILKKLGIYHPLQSFYRDGIQKIKRIYYRNHYSTYKGSGYTCNFCHSTYSRFVPIYPSTANKAAIENNQVIAGYGQNMICPNCLSTARERLIKVMLETRIKYLDKQILHFSPEKKVFDFLSKKAHLVTVDFMPGFYKPIDPSVQFADATSLPFDNDYFDLVIGNHIMEHIPDDRKAMREIHRVLKLGGNAILQVPFSNSVAGTFEDPAIRDPKKQSALFGQQDHVRIYQLKDYMDRLRDSGFVVEFIPYESLREFDKYAIQPHEGFISIKK